MIRVVIVGLALLVTACLCATVAPTIMVVVLLRLIPGSILMVALAVVPLCMYAIASAFMVGDLTQPLPDRMQPHLHDKQGRSLTLAGFSFASLAILVRVYGAQVADYEEAAIGLALSLAFFIAAYMLLRHRERNAFDFFSDALLDSGLWCILASLAFLFHRVFESAIPVALMGLLMAAFIVWVGFHLTFYVKYGKD